MASDPLAERAGRTAEDGLHVRADQPLGGRAVTLVSAYQGMSLLTNALRDPEIMTREGARLLRWLDSLPG